MDKAVIESQAYETNVRREIRVLNLLEHPAIVRYVGSFDTKQSVYIVLEYLQNGDLQQVCMYVCMCVYINMCFCVCVRVCVCVCVCGVCVVCVCVNTHIHIHIRIHTYVLAYIHTNIHTHTHHIQILASKGSLSVSSARFVIAEILTGLEHMHDKGVVYGDLKPENVLLDGKNHCKLSDFGSSRIVNGACVCVCVCVWICLQKIIVTIPNRILVLRAL
jgi:serine/threonine protein kinase